MPPPRTQKRMTANPVKPSRYRPGKGPEEEPSSDEDAESQEEQEQKSAPPPKTSSFPSDSGKIAANLRKVNLDERRAQAVVEEKARIEAEAAERAVIEAEFETEESEEEEDSEDEEESSEEESSSEEEAPRKLLRPTFIRKDKRKDTVTAEDIAQEQKQAEDEARRKEKANELIQEQLEKNAAAKAAGKKYWDDDEEVDGEEVDDTDDIDPEAERAAWKLRELIRIKREREAIEQAEKEREEVERRRNLSKEEREAEDAEFLAKQKEERQGKGQMNFMAKYHHKGAFFQDEGLDKRDMMGSRVVDEINREILPEYMQIRDMTKLGKRSRTKYKDMKTEDTGRWGDFGDHRKRNDLPTGVDERFRPDQFERSGGASGANATQVKERRGVPEGAPQGPKRDREGQSPDRWTSDQRDSRRKRSYSRSRSPPRRRERRDSRDERRDGSYSRSRSPPRRRDRRDSREQRKRSPSPYGDRYDSDKRRRVEV